MQDVVTRDAVRFPERLDGRAGSAPWICTGGELLEGVHLSGAPDFDRWLDPERRRLRRRAMEGALAAAG